MGCRANQPVLDIYVYILDFDGNAVVPRLAFFNLLLGPLADGGVIYRDRQTHSLVIFSFFFFFLDSFSFSVSICGYLEYTTTFIHLVCLVFLGFSFLATYTEMGGRTSCIGKIGLTEHTQSEGEEEEDIENNSCWAEGEKRVDIFYV